MSDDKHSAQKNSDNTDEFVDLKSDSSCILGEDISKKDVSRDVASSESILKKKYTSPKIEELGDARDIGVGTITQMPSVIT